MNKREKIEQLKAKYSNVPEIDDIITEARKIEIEDFDRNHKPIWDLEDYKDYRRHMIMLRPDICMLIHLFKRDLDQNLEDAWLDDNDAYAVSNYDCITDSAHQLMLQLEGHYCQAFIKALKKEVDAILEKENETIIKAEEKYKIAHEN